MPDSSPDNQQAQAGGATPRPGMDVTPPSAKTMTDDPANSSITRQQDVVEAPLGADLADNSEESEVGSSNSDTNQSQSQPDQAVDTQQTREADLPSTSPLAIANQPSTPPSHNRRNFGVIVLVVLITIILAGLAVLAFLNSKQDPSQPNEPATEMVTPQTEVTSDEVDTLTQEIEETLDELNDAQDFPQDELSDENLDLQPEL